jgi:hypothetical protein
MTTTSSFDGATAVHARDNATYDVTVDPEWSVGDKPNGGYLLAMLGRAAIDSVVHTGSDHPHPLAASATYLRAPGFGPAEIVVELLRAGRSASHVRACLRQDGRAQVESTFTLGRLQTGTEPRWSGVPPVEVPPEEDCDQLAPVSEGGNFPSGVLSHTIERVDPAVLGFGGGTPGGTAEMRGWLRFTDGRQPDPLSLLYLSDAFPPATLDLGSTGWVPTLQLTAYVRALPEPGPLRARQRARLVEGGMVDQVCDLWDSSGRFVAQSVQLAQVRFPDDAIGTALR